MNKPSFFVLTLFFLFTALIAKAQSSPVKPNYEISLFTVVGTNQAQQSKTNLPASLISITDKFKELFEFDNYRLVSTSFVRGTTEANIEFSQPLRDENFAAPYFSDWSLRGLKPAGGDNKQIQFSGFNYGLRIPILMRQASSSENEKASPQINYERVGLTIGGFNVPENVPTLIGSIPSQQKNEVIFLILFVKTI